MNTLKYGCEKITNKRNKIESENLSKKEPQLAMYILDIGVENSLICNTERVLGLILNIFCNIILKFEKYLSILLLNSINASSSLNDAGSAFIKRIRSYSILMYLMDNAPPHPLV